MQAADQGVQDVLTTTFPTARAVEAHGPMPTSNSLS